MSTDKENIKPKSKIPVLKEKSMLRRVKGKNERSIPEVQRDPLKTIANENVDENCCSGSTHDIAVLDTRYVTHRDNKEELDWKFEVFGGSSHKILKNVPIEEVISGSSILNGLTPDVSEPVTKKVKKSLKRPHCIGIRDSTGIVCPIATNTPVSPPLLSIESEPVNFNNPHELHGLCIDLLSKRYALDNLKYLLRTEKKMVEHLGIRTASRACVINWIVKVHISSGNPAIVQQACWYLDKYLSSAWVTIPRLQVIAAACFWIATKLYGGYISGRRLVKYSGHAFVINELIAAEKHILRKLNFQVLSAVPHDFVPFFSMRCGGTHSADVKAAATFLCLCGLMVDKTLNKEYPSVVAAAAVKISIRLLHKGMCMDQLQSCCIYKSAEEKASNLSRTCDQLYAALRVIRSAGYVYKALIEQFSQPPNFIVTKIFQNI